MSKSGNDKSKAGRHGSAGELHTIREASYSLDAFLEEIELEKSESRLGYSLVSQEDIGKMFEKKRKDGKGQ